MAPKTLSAIALLGAVTGADAFWRMECRGKTGVARMDPIVDFGEVSTHAHSVHGSSGFSLGATYDDLRGGSCTSCAVKEDMSAYWTPALYFSDSDTGEFEIVEQVGGMLAYYLLRGDNITAFPPDFTMIAGSNTRRNYTVGDPNSPDPPKSNWAALKQTSQADLEQRALGFNCMNYNKDAEASLFRHYLPDKDYTDANCPDGLRLELMFPSCWNGEANSDDHKSHVAFPSLVGEGDCPESHPQRLPTLFYETIWATGAEKFVGRKGEFVVSNGDPTGFGYHGDFMTGWDVDFLQDAIDRCTNESGELLDCPTFTEQGPLRTLDEMTSCKFDTPSVLKDEDCTALNLDSLPGGVKVQYGPEAATVGGGALDQFTSWLGIGGDETSSTSRSAPSLTYSPATTPTYEVAEAATSAPEAATSAPTGGAFIESSVADTAAVNVLATSSSTSSTPVPTTTSAPLPTSEPGVSYQVVSTQTITTGVQVEEVVWEEPVVYVTEDCTTTVTADQQQKVRREHAWKHRHNGRAR